MSQDSDKQTAAVVDAADAADAVDGTTARTTAARWVTVGHELVEGAVEAILREEAWWVAVRTGRYPQLATVWAEQGPAAACTFPLPIGCSVPGVRRRT